MSLLNRITRSNAPGAAFFAGVMKLTLFLALDPDVAMRIERGAFVTAPASPTDISIHRGRRPRSAFDLQQEENHDAQSSHDATG